MARIDTTNTELFEGSEETNDNPQHITKYPKNWVTVTSAGHVLEFDNTEDGERIRLIHGKSGSLIEMDEQEDTYLISKRDLHLNSDKTTTLKVGKNKKDDKLIIQVIGDAHLNVEGNLHTEVEGNRYDHVAGEYQLHVGGAMMIDSSSNIGINADNELRVIANSVNQRCTFAHMDMKAGGQLTEEINGNRVIRMNKEGGTFAIESAGDLRFNVKGCHYNKVGRNSITEVDGKVKTIAHGDKIDCIEGGQPSGMDTNLAAGIGWDLQTGSSNVNISTKDFVMSASGSANMSASSGTFTITCNNGIYLN
jgi:hypothetical protein